MSFSYFSFCLFRSSFFFFFFFFFFNDTATTEIYTLSLHDALPISLEALRYECVIDQVLGDHDVRHRRERSEEHTSELQSHSDLVCRLLLEKKKKKQKTQIEQETNKKKALDTIKSKDQKIQDADSTA